MKFPGRRVVVAGAARGIGRANAEGFAERGAHVCACDLLVEEVARFAGASDTKTGNIRAAQVDVTDAQSVERVVATARPAENQSIFWCMSRGAFAAGPRNRSRA
jgi:3-oxoacyl-[acyl-carrier protein] reductase